MTLKLYAHPLSSYCHKALIAFYENNTPFEFLMVGDPTKTDPKVWEEFKALWPIGKFPVLKDTGRDDWFVPEATIIIEYLAQHYPGKTKLIPDDPDLARRVRMMDRFFDNYLHTPMQKINFDKIRPADQRDPAGVEDAKKMYRTALDMLEQAIDGKQWAEPSQGARLSRTPESAPVLCARAQGSGAVFQPAAEVTGEVRGDHHHRL